MREEKWRLWVEGDFEIGEFVDRGSKSQSGSGAKSIEIIPSKHDSSILNKNSHRILGIYASTLNRLLKFSELSILRDPTIM